MKNQEILTQALPEFGADAYTLDAAEEIIKAIFGNYAGYASEKDETTIYVAVLTSDEYMFNKELDGGGNLFHLYEILQFCNDFKAEIRGKLTELK